MSYNVNILDESDDYILWVSFEHKESLQGINVCVCYLSPEGSSHMVEPHECFDQLLSQIYMFQNNGQYIICGDFNARCGNEADYIEEVDDVIERSIVDHRKNHYGDILLDLLINSNCVMLNGRCAGDNDFTSISVKGVSVVDYVVVPHDYLHKCSGFCVKRAHDLFVQTDLLGRCDLDRNLSDHSMLVWKYKLDDLYSDLTIKRNSQLIQIRKYDVSQVPDDFMCDTAITINVNDICTDIDQSYLNFCDVVKSEMETSLPSKFITLNTSKQRQVFSRVKPWWTGRLKDLWASCCVAERNMGIVGIMVDNCSSSVIVTWTAKVELRRDNIGTSNKKPY